MASIPYETRQEGDAMVVDLNQEIDLHHSTSVKAHIGAVLQQQPPTLIVNLQHVTYIDSSGLATLIDTHQKMKAYQGKLILRGMNEPVRKVFEVARLDRYFTIL